MKILIDIGHPAHVHYFKNFIQILSNHNYDFLIIARDKECSLELLKKYKINHINRGKGRNSLIGKVFYALYANYIILKESIRFKPDILISFGSPSYCASIGIT